MGNAGGFARLAASGQNLNKGKPRSGNRVSAVIGDILTAVRAGSTPNGKSNVPGRLSFTEQRNQEARPAPKRNEDDPPTTERRGAKPLTNSPGGLTSVAATGTSKLIGR